MSTTEETISATVINGILRGIALGDFDDHLESIHDAVRERRRVRVAAVAAEVTSDIRYGDRVRLTVETRPKYMIGAEGTVTKVNGASFRVKLDDPSSRFGAEPRVPRSLIEKVA